MIITTDIPATDRRAEKALFDIIRDANRMTPEQVAAIVRDADLYGTPDSVTDTAAGNYIAHQALIAGVAPALHTVVYYSSVLLVDTRTEAVLATGHIGGTLRDLEELIADDNDPATPADHYAGFGDLVRDPAEDEPLGAADRAELEAAGPLWPVAHSSAPDFFDTITDLRDSIAA